MSVDIKKEKMMEESQRCKKSKTDFANETMNLGHSVERASTEFQLATRTTNCKKELEKEQCDNRQICNEKGESPKAGFFVGCNDDGSG